MFIPEGKLKQLLMHLNKDAKEATDPYSRYDLYTDKSIVELKSRKGPRVYEDTMIERKKYEACMADEREFIYVVFSEAHQEIFFFNITHLTIEGYDFKWHTKHCNKNTEFDWDGKVDKSVGGISWSKAYHSIPVDPLKDSL